LSPRNLGYKETLKAIAKESQNHPLIFAPMVNNILDRLEITKMKQILVNNISQHYRDNYYELTATLHNQTASQDIWFRTTHSPVTTLADPFVPIALLPAMSQNLRLSIDAPISTCLLRGAMRVQHLQQFWDKSLSLVELNLQPQPLSDLSDPREKDAVGAFFSGGVDSFYTLKKHRQEITHLIFVHGFDIPLWRKNLRELVASRMRKIALELNLELVEVETNLRQYSDRHVGWEDYHGAAMAAVAHFLAPGFSKIYIPSGYAYAFLFPYGSHPGLDPLWGSQPLELVHDGCEATRFEKIQDLASWNFALQNLRVCWQLIEGNYNCCHCRKCLWTMAFLRACKALDRATSFHLPLDLEELSNKPLKQPFAFPPSQIIAAVEEQGDDPQLIQALRKALQEKLTFRDMKLILRKLIRRGKAIIR
jgi:hypothetical protein